MANRDKIERLDELIKDSIGGELLEQTATALLPPGENYGSVMYKVDFKVKKDGEVKEYHAVAKCTPPPNQVTQEFFNTQETFRSETAWYTTVIPTLKQFAKDQGLERDLDFFQQFYGARISLDSKSEKVDLDGVILTENLKYLGYHNIDRHIGFDASETFSILKDLATFHAVPLAFRIKQPNVFESKLMPYCPKWELEGDKMKEIFDNDMLRVFDNVPEVQPYIERIRKAVKESNLFDQRELREPWTSINHSDFWCNNIMVTGGNDSKNMILDLQVPTLGSPAADLVFFLLTSVRLDVIKERYDEFVKFYYDEFIKNLKGLQLDTSDYTFEGLLKEIDTEMNIAEFVHSLGHVQMILMEKGVAVIDSSDVNYSHESIEQIKTEPNEKQIEKFKWIALEAVKRNWI